jgi:hypothetical protein
MRSLGIILLGTSFVSIIGGVRRVGVTISFARDLRLFAKLIVGLR